MLVSTLQRWASPTRTSITELELIPFQKHGRTPDSIFPDLREVQPQPHLCQRAREAELPDKVFESLTCHLGVCSRGSRSKLSMRTHRRIQTVSAECWDDSAPRQYELPA